MMSNASSKNEGVKIIAEFTEKAIVFRPCPIGRDETPYGRTQCETKPLLECHDRAQPTGEDLPTNGNGAAGDVAKPVEEKPAGDSPPE